MNILSNELLQMIIGYLDDASKHQYYHSTYAISIHHSFNPVHIIDGMMQPYNFHKRQLLSQLDPGMDVLHLIIDRKVNNIKWPISVRSLTMSVNDDLYVDNLQFPKTVTQIILNIECNLFDAGTQKFQNITKMTIIPTGNCKITSFPPNLKELIVISRDSRFSYDHLPLDLKIFKVNCNYIDVSKLPKSLTTFNCHTRGLSPFSSLPDSITKLALNNKFGDYQLTKFPENLKILIIKCRLDKKILNFPNKLKSLIFDAYCVYNHPLDNLPELLHTLFLPYGHSYKIILPKSLVKLGNIRSKLNIQYPEVLLKRGDSHDLNIVKGNRVSNLYSNQINGIVKQCKIMSLSVNSMEFVDGIEKIIIVDIASSIITFPDSVRYISMDLIFEKKFVITLPKDLKYLTITAKDNCEIEFPVIPKKLLSFITNIDGLFMNAKFIKIIKKQ